MRDPPARAGWWVVYKVTGNGKTYHGSVEEVHWLDRQRDGWPICGPGAVPEVVLRTHDSALALRLELEHTLEGMRQDINGHRGACYAFEELLPGVRREIGRLFEYGVPEVRGAARARRRVGA